MGFQVGSTHTQCAPNFLGDNVYPMPPYASRGVTPSTFADMIVKFRIPYTMPGEFTLNAQQPGQMFPEDVFRHSIDKPFEVWRMLVRLTALDNATPAVVFEPQPTTMEKRIRLRIRDTAKNENLNAAVQLVDTLITGDEGTWEWEVPYTLVTSEGFEVQVDSAVYPTFCIADNFNANNCAAALATMSACRVEVAFQGYLLILQPASETR